MNAGISTETLSFDEFLAAYDGLRAEWVGGSAHPMPPVTPRHQRLVIFLTALLQHLGEEQEAGTVLSAPVLMRMGESAREPDVMFISRDHEDRVTATCVDGPADLIIEVLSPESRARDRGEKFYEYEESGVREYWLVDPVRESLELFRRSASGRYETVTPDGAGRFHSKVLDGLWIDPAWLWEERLPKLNAILKEWGLV